MPRRPPSPFPRPVEASIPAFLALLVGFVAGLVVAAAAVLTVPPLLTGLAVMAGLLAVVVMGLEAWRVSRRSGRGWWSSLGISLRAGAHFLVDLL